MAREFAEPMSEIPLFDLKYPRTQGGRAGKTHRKHIREDKRSTHSLLG